MSSLIVSNVSDGTLSIPTTYVTNGSAKAWANINGSAATFNGSFNASSLTDNGVGDYTTNFTNSFANDDYAVGFVGEIGRINSIAASNFRVGRLLDNGVPTDGPCHITCTGDLA